MTTLVLCVDRNGVLTSSDGPTTGVDAIEALVTDVGIEDPEDSGVNCLLETLRVVRDMEDAGESAVAAIVSGAGDHVSTDRSVAAQTDDLVDRFDPEAAVVVVDSAEEERLVPIIESRVRVDAVDRVVVRQAHDIESTYYLLKQFLADEELRQTVLVPIGVALLAFPVLTMLAESPAAAVGAIAAVIGSFLLYKGLGVDDWLASVPGTLQDAFYSGQVSLVTYVVAAGLALVGVFVGAIAVSDAAQIGPFLAAMQFAYEGVPWLAMSALAASMGRLLDELLRRDSVRSSFLNLPFGVVAVGLVVRGFSSYFLERAGVLSQLRVESVAVGAVSVHGFALSSGSRLALFVFAGVLVSLVGVRFASYVNATDIEGQLPE